MATIRSYQAVPNQNSAELNTQNQPPESNISREEDSKNVSNSTEEEPKSRTMSFFVNVIMPDQKRLKIECKPDWTVAHLKSVAMPDLTANPMKAIRFIFMGRVLSDQKQLQDCHIESGVAIHVNVVDKTHETFTGQNGGGTPIFGVPVPPAQQQQYDQQQHEPEQSEVDVEMQYPAADFQVEPDIMQYEGGSTDFVLGFIMGLILGPLSVFWMFMRAVPRKQKLGIFTGLAAYSFFSILRVFLEQQEQQNSDNASTP